MKIEEISPGPTMADSELTPSHVFASPSQSKPANYAKTNSRKTAVPITVIIPVRNEAANLAKCLESLEGVGQIIVVDSHSIDDSEKIAHFYEAEFVQFDYQGGYPKKRQWALDQLAIEQPWVLLMDADEEMSPALMEEIQQRISRPDAPDAFLATKGFHFMGKKFRFGGFSHSAVVLIRPEKCRFETMDLDETSGLDMEVHERVLVDGNVGKLKTPLIHNDFKGLQAYVDRHNRYSTWEAAVRRKLIRSGTSDDQVKPSLFGDLQQKRRWLKMLAMRIPFEHWLWFFYHFFFRLGFLEGKRGFIASQVRSQYIANVHAKMFELSESESGNRDPRRKSDSFESIEKHSANARLCDRTSATVSSTALPK